MGRLEGKVALITGAARGQGRSHAIRLAEEGARIVAVDVCKQYDSVPFRMSSSEDLAETVRLVEDLDQRIIAEEADITDLAALESIAQKGIAEFGPIDIVVANAAIANTGTLWELSEEQWDELVAVNLSGQWRTIKATVPQMVDRGEGGSVILISSLAGVLAYPQLGHYNAAKHGVTGLMRSLAVEGAPHSIRCNSIHPSTVSTEMVQNDHFYELFTGKAGATQEDARPAYQSLNALPIPWMEPRDISNMVLFLASDESRYVTGTTQLVDAGCSFPLKIPTQ